jgi:putative transcription factor
MSECELCGSGKANRKTRIDGAVLTVCEKCVGFGEEIRPIEMKIVKKPIPKLEMGDILKQNFNIIISNSRSKMNLKQDELAKKLNEKLSIIKRVEEGWEPTPILISKLEKFFNIELTENPEDKKMEKKTSKERLTIGDVVEIH